MDMTFLKEHSKAVTVEYTSDKKLTVAAIAYFGTVVLLILGKVPHTTYENVTMAIVALYLGANVGQKWVEGKGTNGVDKPAPPAP